MIAKLPYILFLLAGFILPAASPSVAQSDQEKKGYVWPSHYDFFVPYGTNGGGTTRGTDGGSVYLKPGYKGASLTLTCKETTGILKMRGYRDIAELSCSGAIYRFEVSRIEGRFLVEVDSRTGDIIRIQPL
jgi:hypothetical protein